MSGGKEPRLCYVERPVRPGSRLAIRVPAGHAMTGTEPLAAGDGFTVDVTGDEGCGRWRTVLLSWRADGDGVVVEIEVEGRYAAHYDPADQG